MALPSLRIANRVFLLIASFAAYGSSIATTGFASSPVQAPISCRKNSLTVGSITACVLPRSSLPKLRVLSMLPGGGHIGSFTRLDSMLRQQGRLLRFAMNGGMYENDTSATGLLIVDGVELKPLNTALGPQKPCETANFYCPPNGVFFVDDFGAHVESTGDFANHSAALHIRLATQSGPLLVSHGTYAQNFNAHSANRRSRNAVGVTESGAVVFALADSTTFYEFATKLIQLHCRDALYLDGGVSRLYSHGERPLSGDMFASVFVVSDP